jgi:DNA mismatch repair protein MutS
VPSLAFLPRPRLISRQAHRKGLQGGDLRADRGAGKGKKIVDRQVVRVVTPGTLVEDNLLHGAANNYLAALAAPAGSAVGGLAYVDISTGEFACLQAGLDALAAELHRLSPAELLLGPAASAPDGLSATITPLVDFDERANQSALLAHFGRLAGRPWLTVQPLAAAAAGAVVRYLHDSPRLSGHIVRVTGERAGAHMALDPNTLRNLALPVHRRARPGLASGSPLTLVGVLDQTCTAMGTRLLHRWVGQPLLDIMEIRRRQDFVQFFFDSAVRRGQTQALLKKIPTSNASPPASAQPPPGRRPARRHAISSGSGGVDRAAPAGGPRFRGDDAGRHSAPAFIRAREPRS